MLQNAIENEIYSKVKHLTVNQKEEVLSYLERMPMERHSTKLYRHKALRQIRKALKEEA